MKSPGWGWVLSSTTLLSPSPGLDSELYNISISALSNPRYFYVLTDKEGARVLVESGARQLSFLRSQRESADERTHRQRLQVAVTPGQIDMGSAPGPVILPLTALAGEVTLISQTFSYPSRRNNDKPQS